MREYKNLRAIELAKEAKETEELVASKEPQIARNNLPWTEQYLQLREKTTELKVLADDIEDGIIFESELEDA